MSTYSEPDRSCLVVDKDDDVWRWDGLGWDCATNAARGPWEFLRSNFGPVRVYAPEAFARAVRKAMEAMRKNARDALTSPEQRAYTECADKLDKLLGQPRIYTVEGGEPR